MRGAALALVLALWSAAAPAQWRTKDGAPVPDSDSRRSRDGFGVSLLVTPDQDWEEKWRGSTPPTFREARTVAIGGKLTILIFIANPQPDAENRVNVRCDIHLRRPDATVSLDLKDLACLAGPLQGDPRNVRLAAPVIGFVGEPNDPRGEWRVEVTLTDAVRGTKIPVSTSFTLE